MRKLLSILFLSIFCLLQYGKIASYWYCIFSYANYSATASCDCKKILHEDVADAETTLPDKITLKEKVEELFTFPLSETGNEKPHYVFLHNLSRNTSPVRLGFHALVFQPPQS